jgi:hypothetical protein
MSLDKRQNASLIPAPGIYDHTEFNLRAQYGKSFGINHEYYKKMDMPNLNPGPGEYLVMKDIGSDKAKCKIKGVKNW